MHAGGKLVTLVLAVLVLPAGVGRAADQLVVGKGLAVKDPIPPDNVRRFVKILAKEGTGASPSDDTIVGDPTVDGATLRVLANGASSSDQTFSMPAVNWTVHSSISGFGYRYKDKLCGGPVKQAEIKHTLSGIFFVKVGITGKCGPGTLTVVPPNPGTDGAMALTITGGDTYCSSFGGAAGGTVVNKPNGNPFKLFAVHGPTLEVPCPGSPSGAFVDG